MKSDKPNEILALGPFIGDFEQEITTFRPYVQWVIETNPYKTVYISSHINRQFMYDFIDYDKFIPILENITRDELGQDGYMYEGITKQEFNHLIKYFKSIICEKENVVLADIDVISLPYIKSKTEISYYEKIFTPIEINTLEIEDKDFVLFIPDKTPEMDELYNELKEIYNVIVVGDMKSGLHLKNITLKQCNYTQNNYLHIISFMMKADMVITPIPHWAFTVNLQGVPLYYWGEDASVYKTDGVFGFENKKSVAMNINNTNIRQVEYGYGKIQGIK